MHVLNIVTSPRKDQSASRALVDAFLREYMKQAEAASRARSEILAITRTRHRRRHTLDVWREWLPEFDAETINAKYKGVSGEPMTAAEVSAWEKIHEFASRFRRADRIVMGVPMWNFSFPYKLKHLSATAPRSMSRRHLSHSFEGKATRLGLRQFRSLASSIRAGMSSFGCDS
jgi:FMN-dependent NADH-azoreductase